MFTIFNRPAGTADNTDTTIHKEGYRDCSRGESCDKHSHFRTFESDSLKCYVFPRRPFSDLIVSILRNIQAFSEPNVGTACNTHIVTPRFRSSRIAVAATLETLHRNGATIEIVCRGPHVINEDDKKEELSPSVEKTLKRCAHRYYQKENINIHSKYLLINAPYVASAGGYQQQALVWVGSPT